MSEYSDSRGTVTFFMDTFYANGTEIERQYDDDGRLMWSKPGQEGPPMALCCRAFQRLAARVPPRDNPAVHADSEVRPCGNSAVPSPP
jgi:hypothetical protein